MTELELKNGQSFIFMDQYETIEAIVVYSNTVEGPKAYKILINGRPVVISKSFKFMNDKLDELIIKHRLINSKSK